MHNYMYTSDPICYKEKSTESRKRGMAEKIAASMWWGNGAVPSLLMYKTIAALRWEQEDMKHIYI